MRTAVRVGPGLSAAMVWMRLIGLWRANRRKGRTALSQTCREFVKSLMASAPALGQGRGGSSYRTADGSVFGMLGGFERSLTCLR